MITATPKTSALKAKLNVPYISLVSVMALQTVLRRDSNRLGADLFKKLSPAAFGINQ